MIAEELQPRTYLWLARNAGSDPYQSPYIHYSLMYVVPIAPFHRSLLSRGKRKCFPSSHRRAEDSQRPLFVQYGVSGLWLFQVVMMGMDSFLKRC